MTMTEGNIRNAAVIIKRTTKSTTPFHDKRAMDQHKSLPIYQASENETTRLLESCCREESYSVTQWIGGNRNSTQADPTDDDPESNARDFTIMRDDEIVEILSPGIMEEGGCCGTFSLDRFLTAAAVTVTSVLVGVRIATSSRLAFDIAQGIASIVLCTGNWMTFELAGKNRIYIRACLRGTYQATEDIKVVKVDIEVIKTSLQVANEFIADNTLAIDQLRFEIHDLRYDFQEASHKIHAAFQNMQDKVQDNIQDLRDEVRYDIQDLRNELRNDMQDLRNELRNDMQHLRDEVRNDIHALRDEVRNDIQTLCGEVQDLGDEVRNDIQELRGMHQTTNTKLDKLTLKVDMVTSNVQMLIEHLCPSVSQPRIIPDEDNA